MKTLSSKKSSYHPAEQGEEESWNNLQEINDNRIKDKMKLTPLLLILMNYKYRELYFTPVMFACFVSFSLKVFMLTSFLKNLKKKRKNFNVD